MKAAQQAGATGPLQQQEQSEESGDPDSSSNSRRSRRGWHSMWKAEASSASPCPTHTMAGLVTTSSQGGDQAEEAEQRIAGAVDNRVEAGGTASSGNKFFNGTPLIVSSILSDCTLGTLRCDSVLGAC